MSCPTCLIAIAGDNNNQPEFSELFQCVDWKTVAAVGAVGGLVAYLLAKENKATWGAAALTAGALGTTGFLMWQCKEVEAAPPAPEVPAKAEKAPAVAPPTTIPGLRRLPPPSAPDAVAKMLTAPVVVKPTPVVPAEEVLVPIAPLLPPPPIRPRVITPTVPISPVSVPTVLTVPTPLLPAPAPTAPPRLLSPVPTAPPALPTAPVPTAPLTLTAPIPTAPTTPPTAPATYPTKPYAPPPPPSYTTKTYAPTLPSLSPVTNGKAELEYFYAKPELEAEKVIVPTAPSSDAIVRLYPKITTAAKLPLIETPTETTLPKLSVAPLPNGYDVAAESHPYATATGLSAYEIAKMRRLRVKPNGVF
jgi:hypothetical protein